MVILDTNFMIAMVNRDLSATNAVKEWLEQGEEIATSSAAWAEFCTASVEAHVLNDMEWLFQDRILPFGRTDAECASRLFRATGCKRQDRIDTFVAATAIVAQAQLATRDQRGFQRFVPFGLKLA